MNPTAIEAHLKLVLLQWMIIIAVAWIFGRLGKRLGHPLAVGEILAGLLLGPSALGLIWPHDWPVLLVGTTEKLGGCWLGARASGQPNRDPLSLAALMNTRALMGLVAINVGADIGLLPKELFTRFVIMSLLTTAMTGPLLKLWLPDEIRHFVPGFSRGKRDETKPILTSVS